jgi:hypothetical protein
MVPLRMNLPRLRTLEELTRWGAAQSPPRTITDVVIQDEYTHDVVMPYDATTYLVFDTT